MNILNNKRALSVREVELLIAELSDVEILYNGEDYDYMSSGVKIYLETEEGRDVLVSMEPSDIRGVCDMAIVAQEVLLEEIRNSVSYIEKTLELVEIGNNDLVLYSLKVLDRDDKVALIEDGVIKYIVVDVIKEDNRVLLLTEKY